MTSDNEKLIEEAAKALDANFNPDKHPIMAAMFRDYAATCLAVFEKAHTPTDDERGTLEDRYYGDWTWEGPFSEGEYQILAARHIVATVHREEDLVRILRAVETQGEPSDAQEAVRRMKDAGVSAFTILGAVTKVFEMETKS